MNEIILQNHSIKLAITDNNDMTIIAQTATVTVSYDIIMLITISIITLIAIILAMALMV